MFSSSQFGLGVSDKGIITGSAIGKTRVNAKAIGVHPTTGQSMVYSEVSLKDPEIYL